MQASEQYVRKFSQFACIICRSVQLSKTANLRAQIAALKMCRNSETGELGRGTIKNSATIVIQPVTNDLVQYPVHRICINVPGKGN